MTRIGVITGRTAIAAVALTMVLSGCSGRVEGADMTPQEARAQFVALLDRTQELAGGEWENNDSPSPTECQLPGFAAGTGVTYTAHRLAELSPIPEAAVEKITALWESAGMEVGTAGIGAGTSMRGVNTEDQSFFVILETGSRISVLQGHSRCVPGDILEELEKDELEQQSGEVRQG